MNGKKTATKARPKRGRGRPAYKPTDADHRLVETHVAFGTPHDDICLLIINPITKAPITGKTLREHFAQEIKVGGTRANARVVESLFYQAVGRPAQHDAKGRQTRDELKPAVAAAIWWTKARMGWKETSTHELGGPEGGAIPIRLDSLTDGQLEQLIERIEGALNKRS